MRLFKKKTEENYPYIGSIEVRKIWDDATASFKYGLYRYGISCLYVVDWQLVAYGNKAWAERTAKHYRVTIQEAQS